ncbi:hypothetical protein [Nocardioides bizhenqiangii]|uniref:NUDIX hydrolase n=1 Tax=Nocardioides bizhenqiangii TaxID=3095076 RepID=A0ABZ0ZRF2_9ACTN|nr:MULTISPECIES: hypothetical protein [unclassified Nocardioides]MDZ5619487.1 hypothetical protein [Nocardioides sp. HM23]WQQ26496.1 hypothetical protein SHK19_21385 [Nocardioides sp. HM61]
MYDVTMTERVSSVPQPAHLEMRWLPVTDAQGTTRMQAVWIEAGAAMPVAPHHAA